MDADLKVLKDLKSLLSAYCSCITMKRAAQKRQFRNFSSFGENKEYLKRRYEDLNSKKEVI
jgi:hypothetical protein